MTVKLLKELLEKVPDDASVCFYHVDEDCSESLANAIDYDEDFDIVYLM